MSPVQPRPTDPPPVLAWLPTSMRARWLFAVAAAVLAAVLLGSAGSGYFGAEGLSSTLTRSQGIMFMHAVRRGLPRDVPPAATDLAAVIDDGAALGLTYVAVLDERGTLLAEAGSPAEDGFVSADPFEVVREGDVARVSAPFRIGGSPSGSPPSALARIEFVPRQAIEVERWAQRDLAVAISGTILLALVTGVFWAMARRAELVERKWIEQRHLAALGEMSAVLAHELRNPLSSLKGHAQLLEERLDGKLREKAGRVVEGAVRLEQLVEGLLAFVRSGKLVRTAVDPAALARAAAAALVGPSERGDAAIEIDVDDAPPLWSLDAARTQQVLVNLLENAVAVSEGASVMLRVARVDRELHFEVRDRGPGVAPSDRKAIFEPFHTTKTRGAGLGLAVSRRIVEAHGGAIEVVDADRGALFRVRIPAGEDR
jgi:two-component system sensor histidine kinase HydH